MKSIPTPRPYDWKKDTKQENKSKLKNSRTIPDMHYTIRQIMDKFTTGQSIAGMGSYNEFDGEYENNRFAVPDFSEFQPHPKTLDLVDRQHMAEANRKEIAEIQSREKTRQSEKQKLNDKDKQTIQDLTNKINILENPAGGK